MLYFCRVSLPLVHWWVHWSSPLSVWFPLGTKAFTVRGQHREQQGVWLWHSQANGDSGHTGSRPFIAIMCGPSANCWELAGVRRGEAGGLDWGGFMNWGMEGGREGCGRGQGDGRSLGTEQLAAASAQHRDEWASRNREYFHQPFLIVLVFFICFCFCFLRRLSVFLSLILSVNQCLTWISILWCLRLCYALPPVCGQRAGACM